MPESAPRIEDGNAAAQVLGGGGHVLQGQREAGEVDAFRGHPVLHQTLAGERGRREIVDATLGRHLRRPDAVHVGVGDDAEDVLPPQAVGGQRDGEEGREERQVLSLAGVLDDAAAESLEHQPVQPHRSEGRLGQVAKGVVGADGLQAVVGAPQPGADHRHLVHTRDAFVQGLHGHPSLALGGVDHRARIGGDDSLVGDIPEGIR
jgi:hypothetical protein